MSDYCLKKVYPNYIVKMLMCAIQKKKESPNFLSELNDYPKKAQEFMEYQYKELEINRSAWNDRLFPLETVEIKSFNIKHDKDVEKVFIHAGPSADEYARSMNALAITIANNIYFRNNKFNPGSEEGKKLLAHEMTHISQYEKGRIAENIAREELEDEAEKAEVKEEYESDPMVTVEFGGKLLSFRKSQMGRVVKETANNIREYIEKEKNLLSEEEYFHLLCRFRDWIERRI